jgi:hypothetical protein
MHAHTRKIKIHSKNYEYEKLAGTTYNFEGMEYYAARTEPDKKESATMHIVCHDFCRCIFCYIYAPHMYSTPPSCLFDGSISKI